MLKEPLPLNRGEMLGTEKYGESRIAAGGIRESCPTVVVLRIRHRLKGIRNCVVTGQAFGYQGHLMVADLDPTVFWCSPWPFTQYCYTNQYWLETTRFVAPFPWKASFWLIWLVPKLDILLWCTSRSARELRQASSKKPLILLLRKKRSSWFVCH